MTSKLYAAMCIYQDNEQAYERSVLSEFRAFFCTFLQPVYERHSQETECANGARQGIRQI